MRACGCGCFWSGFIHEPHAVPMAMMKLPMFLLSIGSGSVVATGYCNDRSASCAAWAKDGECGGANAEYLSMLCPHSCGTCTLTCEDTDISCTAWAQKGLCKENAGYMLRACPTSCGLCTPTCKDTHDDCAGWTTSGACQESESPWPTPPLSL